jgi:hypothetical protein
LGYVEREHQPHGAELSVPSLIPVCVNCERKSFQRQRLIERLKWQAGYLQAAFDVRAAELTGDEQKATEYRRMVQAMVARHKNDGTVLERGYGYKPAPEID